jgi:hypothetical protein
VSYYSLKKPCGNCPFLKEGGIRLRPARAEEIAMAAISSQGARFSCHETTIPIDSDEDLEGDRVDGKNAKQCAGAMLFALNQDQLNQGMRIAERLRLWEPNAMTGHNLVFEDLDAMYDANVIAGEPGAVRPPKPSYQIQKAELKRKLLKGTP